jgi:hypothetical protein
MADASGIFIAAGATPHSLVDAPHAVVVDSVGTWLAVLVHCGASHLHDTVCAYFMGRRNPKFDTRDGGGRFVRNGVNDWLGHSSTKGSSAIWPVVHTTRASLEQHPCLGLMVYFECGHVSVSDACVAHWGFFRIFPTTSKIDTVTVIIGTVTVIDTAINTVIDTAINTVIDTAIDTVIWYI